MKVFDLNDVACEVLGLSCLQKEWNYACNRSSSTYLHEPRPHDFFSLTRTISMVPGHFEGT